MEKTNIITTTYKLTKDYYLDEVYNGKIYEYWIYSKDYGIKTLTYGVPERMLPTLRELISYINIYQEEYEN